jgi:hypothetical protein
MRLEVRLSHLIRSPAEASNGACHRSRSRRTTGFDRLISTCSSRGCPRLPWRPELALPLLLEPACVEVVRCLLGRFIVEYAESFCLLAEDVSGLVCTARRACSTRQQHNRVD